MRRIVILGSAGSGKSTLARRLGAQLGIPVIHLDALSWEPGWKALTTEAFRSRLQEAISGDGWVTDGNYAVHSFDLRLPRADLVIWLKRPPLQCAWRVIRRAVASHFSGVEDLSPGCKERFDRKFLARLQFIANFNRINRPRIEAARAVRGPEVPVVVLRGDCEISAFLAGLRQDDLSSGQPDPKYPAENSGPMSMSDPQESKTSQPDKNRAAEERPVPSQAEGDLETIEEDLKQKESKNK